MIDVRRWRRGDPDGCLDYGLRRMPIVAVDPGKNGAALWYPPPATWRSRMVPPMRWLQVSGPDDYLHVAEQLPLEWRLDRWTSDPRARGLVAGVLLVEEPYLGRGGNARTAIESAEGVGVLVGAAVVTVGTLSIVVVTVPAASWQTVLGLRLGRAPRRSERKAAASAMAAPSLRGGVVPFDDLGQGRRSGAADAACMAAWWAGKMNGTG